MSVAGFPSLLELDRFSEADLDKWNERSKDLNELSAVLYSGLEPQRQRYHGELTAALMAVRGPPVDFTGWVRIVLLRYVDSPLSAAGSLRDIGGRFNAGVDVDNAIRSPWPALYTASDQETSYREKFGLAKDARVDGLSAEELALQPGASYSVIRLSGHLATVFDLSKPGNLDPVCKVLRKFKLPTDAVKLRNRLKIPRQEMEIIRTPARLMQETMTVNWRSVPAQFGNPAVSQLLGALIVDSGYEAIRYPSTKGAGECLAVFPHRLASDSSFVELADPAPASIQYPRLDLSTADELCGWEALPDRLGSQRNP